MDTEKRQRVIAKALSWRAVASLVTFILAWIITGEIMTAVWITAIEIPLKMALFAVYDRYWRHSQYGVSKEFKPCVLWFTGLSGAGKTTLAKAVEAGIQERGVKTVWLDGDVTRDVFPRTGFSKEERDAHVLRSGFMAKMIEASGATVIASYISPYAETRRKVRDMCENFVEIHVATPLHVCEKRDVKGLYKKARSGKISNFTGIDDPYEVPEEPELCINTHEHTIEESRDKVLQYLGLL